MALKHLLDWQKDACSWNTTRHESFWRCYKFVCFFWLWSVLWTLRLLFQTAALVFLFGKYRLEPVDHRCPVSSGTTSAEHAPHVLAQISFMKLPRSPSLLQWWEYSRHKASYLSLHSGYETEPRNSNLVSQRGEGRGRGEGRRCGIWLPRVSSDQTKLGTPFLYYDLGSLTACTAPKSRKLKRRRWESIQDSRDVVTYPFLRANPNPDPALTRNLAQGGGGGGG